MLGPQVASDLELSTLTDHIPTSTPWGKELFLSGLTRCTNQSAEIRSRQLPLLVWKTEPDACQSTRSLLQTIDTTLLDDCFQTKDPRIEEQITQILWSKQSLGACLNTSPLLLNSVCVWKTILMPLFAIVVPICLMLLPLVLQLTLCTDRDVERHVSDYLNTLRQVLMTHIRVPPLLQARHSNDHIGFALETLFLGLTVAMFGVSIWNQISTARHLRTIWFDMDTRGLAIHNLRSVVQATVTRIQSLPNHKQRGLRVLLQEGERALHTTAHLLSCDNVSAFGSAWNDATPILALKDWIAKVDVLVSIASLPNICFPRTRTKIGIELVRAYHPNVPNCVPNDFSLDSHCILTGPNRGGKSTFCKTVGLALLTAQSWGFAYAKRMSWSPFATIQTVLEPCGKLGVASTFEAEIEFANTVLALPDTPTFVMMDEIFHSTNAKDGVYASKVFLDRLYTRTNIVSVISTHYTELATHYKDVAVQTQVVTKDDGKGNLTYTYTVREGISDVSSVREILHERGMLLAL